MNIVERKVMDFEINDEKMKELEKLLEEQLTKDFNETIQTVVKENPNSSTDEKTVIAIEVLEDKGWNEIDSKFIKKLVKQVEVKRLS